MLKKLLGKFSTVLYVQIWEERIRVSDVESKRVFDEPPLVAIRTASKGEKTIFAVGSDAKSLGVANDIELVNPFSHPRLLLSDFQVGEKLLQHVFRLLSKGWFPSSPAVVVHPMEKLEGGLTEIEIRAFRELALGAGAREVVIHQGRELPIVGFDYQALKDADTG